MFASFWPPGLHLVRCIKLLESLAATQVKTSSRVLCNIVIEPQIPGEGVADVCNKIPLKHGINRVGQFRA